MQDILKHPELEDYFRDADYLDVKSIEAKTGLRAFIAGMLSYYPWWVVMLYRIRQVLVGLLGLVKHEKPEQLPSFTGEDIPFTPGQNASFFIVRKAKEQFYWLSETPPDNHLTAYFGVAAYKMDGGISRFEVVTAIRYLHWTGPVYFNIIRPFHHLVLARMMRAGAAMR